MRSFSTLVGSLATLGLGLLGRARRPQLTGRLRLTGLHAPVEIIRDQWGVPHIYARDDHDALVAQGFVHAQDRLWQMDFNRRLVAGRLAEVLGSPALAVDRWLRITTMRRVAEQEASLLGDGVGAEMAAYAAGVNAFIARGRLPIEFLLLGYRPEPWNAADTLAWIKFMSWSLSVNWESEILRAQLIARLGEVRAAELEPPYFDRWPTVVPPGVDWSAIRNGAVRRAEAARPFAWPPPYAGLGSNNWVIAGARTTTGRPLLANDMHLPMLIPAIWYENHLVGDRLNVTGVTFPGVPAVVAGHNEHVGWGFTNGFPDVQDLYVERLRRADDGRVQAEYNGDWCDAQVLHEVIRVRRGATAHEDVVVTRHGPVINNLAPEFAAEPPLALRWTSLEPDEIVRGLLEMNRAHSCGEFRAGLRHFSAPVQNVVYADTGGDIAYSLPGRIPVRARGDGRLPVPGWTDEYEWVGTIPFDELPHMLNPAQGYLASANNRVVGDDYPHYLGDEVMMGDRAARIAEMIESREKVDIPFVRQMQYDQFSATAHIVAGYLGRLAADEPQLAQAVQLLRDWDGILAPESPAAAIYQAFLRRVIPMMLERHLGGTESAARPEGSGAGGADLISRYAGRGPTPVVLPRSLFGERSLEWLQRTLEQPDSPWFDLGHGERRDDVLLLALRRTLEQLNDRLGPDTQRWAWGRLHSLTLSHLLSNARPLAPFFSRGPFPLGGDTTTIWATTASQHDLSSQDVISPPFRMILDVGDWRNCLAMLAPGQSGDPTSPHYDDQLSGWLRGDYHPMLFVRADVERAAEARLEIVPGD